MKTKQFTTIFLICVLGILPVAATAQPYVISADGTEVTDQKTGLIWKRCSEGQSWNGSYCIGTPGMFTHEGALQQAAVQATSTGVAWRLPNVKELSSIIDRSHAEPAINSQVFPGTPMAGFWSSTPVAGDPAIAWGGDFLTGMVGMGVRSWVVYVRLVRSGQ